MQVIPAINCLDFECVKKRVLQIKDLGAEWAHIDLSDGKFTPVVTWNEPDKLIAGLNMEVHLMVEKPVEYVRQWLGAGPKRIIVHVETVDREKLQEILEMVDGDVEIGLALRPETEVEVLEPYLEDSIKFIQLLSVNPGFSGQEFQLHIVDKIREIRKLSYGHNVTIEIDGGVNFEVARLVKEAGADVLVSASYILDSVDPSATYEELGSL